jgi:hypothetical protein
LQDHNSFSEPNKIKPAAFNGATLKGDNLTVVLPPFSVVVLTTEIMQATPQQLTHEETIPFPSADADLKDDSSSHRHRCR